MSSTATAQSLLHVPHEHWYTQQQQSLDYNDIGLGDGERYNRQLLSILSLAKKEAKIRNEKQKQNKHDKNAVKSVV